MLKPSIKELLSSLSPQFLIGCAVVLAVLGWTYGPIMLTLMGRWTAEQEYNWCFLVVPFSCYVLWLRRDIWPEPPWTGSLWGLAILGLAAAMRIGGAFTQFNLFEQISIIPCLAGLVVLVWGWPGMRWSWPALLFLAFMVPLPSQLSQQASEPLQRLGAVTSTYLLQTIGIPAEVQGTVIHLSQWPLNVEEACSGLRMLMLFLAVCTGAAMIVGSRDIWERLVLVLSAPPIAVIANVIRITMTGILYERAGREWAEMVFHDLFGWFMMPLAVVLLWLEMHLLSLLVHPSRDEDWA